MLVAEPVSNYRYIIPGRKEERMVQVEMVCISSLRKGEAGTLKDILPAISSKICHRRLEVRVATIILVHIILPFTSLHF